MALANEPAGLTWPGMETVTVEPLCGSRTVWGGSDWMLDCVDRMGSLGSGAGESKWTVGSLGAGE